MFEFSLSFYQASGIIGTLLCLLASISILSYQNSRLKKQEEVAREFAVIQNGIISDRRYMHGRIKKHLENNSKSREIFESMETLLAGIVKKEAALYGTYYSALESTHVERGVNFLSKAMLLVGTSLLIISLIPTLKG